MSRFNTKTLVTMALLTALEIVLSRFLSIQTQVIKISFAFVPVVIAAVLLGPLEAGVVAALSDVLGAVLFPTGPFFPGFTLTAFLMGVVYGLFLHKKAKFRHVLLAVAIHQLLLSLLLNSLWISILYGPPYGALLLTRLPQCALLAVVQLLVIPLLLHLAPRLKGGRP